MFWLLIPAVLAMARGFQLLGEAGSECRVGDGLIFDIECGSDLSWADGVILPKPIVEWGLVLLGVAITLFFVHVKKARAGDEKVPEPPAPAASNDQPVEVTPFSINGELGNGEGDTSDGICVLPEPHRALGGPGESAHLLCFRLNREPDPEWKRAFAEVAPPGYRIFKALVIVPAGVDANDGLLGAMQAADAANEAMDEQETGHLSNSAMVKAFALKEQPRSLRHRR